MVGVGLGVAVLAVAAAVLVPVLTHDPAGAADPVPAAAAAGPGQLDWAARGPLAGDRALLGAALRTWRDGVPARQRPDSAAVLYAGAPDGARLVLLQGTDPAGQAWAAEVTDTGGGPALRTAEPLGRAAPLLAVGTGAGTRLLAPAGATVLVLAAGGTEDAPLRRLAADPDGLTEPVVPGAGGLAAVVLRGGEVLGSGSVRPGRLAAVSGTVEIAAGTLGLGPGTDVRPVWYADGALLARRLGGPVTVAAAGPARSTAVRVGGATRRLDARGYEVVRGGTRHLASVIRLAGRAVCVQTAEIAPGRAPVLVARCVPAGAPDGVLHAVAADGVRTVRVKLGAPGRPARLVTVTGPAGDGMSGLARMPRPLTGPAPAEARTAGGTAVAKFTVPAYRGPRV